MRNRQQKSEERYGQISEDKGALKELVERDAYYKNMEEDAFDVVVQYTNATELVEAKDYYRKTVRWICVQR